MISIKYALVIVAAFAAGSFLTPPVQQAIAAVIATDVQCTGCVGSADLASSAVTTTKLASNSVNGGKITDGTISAADLGPDSVGASEIKGVTKLIFAKCSYTPGTVPAGTSAGGLTCSAPGASAGDLAIATVHTPASLTGYECIVITRAGGYQTNVAAYGLRNVCTIDVDPGTLEVSMIVFKQ